MWRRSGPRQGSGVLPLAARSPPLIHIVTGKSFCRNQKEVCGEIGIAVGLPKPYNVCLPIRRACRLSVFLASFILWSDEEYAHECNNLIYTTGNFENLRVVCTQRSSAKILCVPLALIEHIFLIFGLSLRLNF